ncbi:hypothetical protein Salat_1706900 [Sesamum alatum]|uniref:DUF4283 domain-containing protein n=1 Tax=Sesamum alatum TaxID=300844 RepID=A0AAE1Y7Q8_9LAMI|nr:hypothetical protein Salat_1706900 [Sesamum alatum]
MDSIDPINSLMDKTQLIVFSDDEEPQLNDHKSTTHYPIIARVLCDKPLNTNAIKITLAKAWGTTPDTQTNTIDQNTVAFLLNKEEDHIRILRASPWSFRGNLVVLKPWLPEEALAEVDLTRFQIWVQVSGLPLQTQKLVISSGVQSFAAGPKNGKQQNQPPPRDSTKPKNPNSGNSGPAKSTSETDCTPNLKTKAKNGSVESQPPNLPSDSSPAKSPSLPASLTPP